MCGLTGLLDIRGGDDTESAVRRMTTAVAHRGPDDEGIAPLAGAGGRVYGAVGHRRLSILDLSSAGHQPMSDASGRYTIVFNGEIYNFRELRRALARDVAFVSDSDTEVVLAGWAIHGRTFLPRLRGMFALAIWDRLTERLVLARDRFGIKPLLHASRGGDGAFAFASELRAILASGFVSRRLDPVALAGYLEMGSVPEPRSAIEGVRMLPAGSIMEVRCSPAGIAVGEAEEFAAPIAPRGRVAERDPRRAAAAVRDALADSVAHHLVSDVPVALFLSGGIDSSLVAALAAQHARDRLDAFTVAFTEGAFDETTAAAEVARRYGIRQHRILLSGDEVRDALPDAFAAMDQPSLDGFNTLALSRAVRDHGFRVVLSGLGGDELFCGYPSFRRAQRLGRIGRPAGRLLRRLTPLLGVNGRSAKAALLFSELDPPRDAYVASRTLLAPTARRALLAVDPPALRQAPVGLTLLQASSWYELTGYMRNTLLRDSDVFSMSCGVELRVPFVDAEVAAASLRVSDTLKLAGGRGKAILVDAFRDLLPRVAWERPKRGFTLPFAEWMRGPLAQPIGKALGDARRVSRVGLDPTGVARLWSDFEAGRGAVSWSRPWALFTLLRWAESVDATAVLDDAEVGGGNATRGAA